MAGAKPLPIPDLSFNGGTQKSSAGAESIAQAGEFGDFYFGGSGAGVGVGTSSANMNSAFIFMGVLIFGALLWKKIK